MSRISFDTAEAVVYDPVAAHRATTRTALYAIGFRRIESMATFESFSECILRRPPDLALCELQGSEEIVCNMIQALRQGTTGHNPFLVIMVTAWENSTSLVTRVLNSGADDLLLRPFSTTMLGARIKAHVERRKGFVITSDYVGPDRRRDAPGASNVEIFTPPNSLKMKAQERLSADETMQRMDAALRSARETLFTEKLRRDAFQIGVLWRLLQDADPSGTAAVDDAAKMGRIAREISLRVRGTPCEPAIEWCDAIAAALEGLKTGADRSATLHLLGHAATTLNTVVAPEKSVDEHVRAIDEAVATIRERETTALAS